MTPDWTAISAIIQLVGTVIVVASLFYVARQVRQNTDALLTSSRQSLLESDIGLISDYLTYSLDPHLILDDVELTAEDERRFVWIIVKAVRIREFAWHQYKSGSLDEKTWQSYMAPVGEMFATDRAKAVLKFYAGSQEFSDLLHDWIHGEKAISENKTRQETLEIIRKFNSKQNVESSADSK